MWTPTLQSIGSVSIATLGNNGSSSSQLTQAISCIGPLHPDVLRNGGNFGFDMIGEIGDDGFLHFSFIAAFSKARDSVVLSVRLFWGKSIMRFLPHQFDDVVEVTVQSLADLG